MISVINLTQIFNCVLFYILHLSIIESLDLSSKRYYIINESQLILTCEDRFVRVELSSADGERYVAKFLVLKQQPEIVGQPALRYFKLCRVTLPGDVYAICHHTDLKEIIKLCRYNETFNATRSRISVIIDIQRYIPRRIS